MGKLHFTFENISLQALLNIQFISSIPFLFIGNVIFNSREMFKSYHGLILIISGSLILTFELIFFTKNVDQHEILLGAILMALGIYIYSIKLTISMNLLTKIGTKYSLMIYLLHPLFIKLINLLCFKFDLESFWFNNTILIFLITLLFSLLIFRLNNRLFRIINGDFS